MNMPTLDFNALIFAFAWTMIQSIWQNGVVAILTHTFLQVFGIKNPNVRGHLFCVALITCVVWAFTTFWGLYQSQLSNSATLAGGTTFAQALNSLTDFDHFEAYDSLYLLDLFWLCGCMILCIKLIYEMFAAIGLKQSGTASFNPEWLLRFEQLKQQIGTKKDIAIRLSQRVTVPCVIGYVKPVVLIPTSLLLGMSPQQIEMIILHELAHIRRHDVLVSFVQATIKIIFFFSPAVHHLSNRIDQEREHACDDLAIDACGDAFLYAKTLQKCAELHLSINPRIAFINHFFERNSMLKQRILRLFANSTEPYVKTRNAASIFL